MTVLGAKEATSEHVSSCYQLPAKKLSFASDDDDDDDDDEDAAGMTTTTTKTTTTTRQG